MATTVGQYCIYVNDIELSARFYSELIGLEVQGHTEIDDVHEIVLAAASGGGRYATLTMASSRVMWLDSV